MLKREITYPDFFTEELITEEFYFNITQTEFFELELSEEGGLGAMLERIVKTENVNRLIEMFQEIILLSYGVKIGNTFTKSDELRTAFKQTSAFDVLFMELATNEAAASTFINAVMPKAIREAVAEQKTQDKPSGPLPTPGTLASPTPTTP